MASGVGIRDKRLDVHTAQPCHLKVRGDYPSCLVLLEVAEANKMLLLRERTEIRLLQDDL